MRANPLSLAAICLLIAFSSGVSFSAHAGGSISVQIKNESILSLYQSNNLTLSLGAKYKASYPVAGMEAAFGFKCTKLENSNWSIQTWIWSPWTGYNRDFNIEVRPHGSTFTSEIACDNFLNAIDALVKSGKTNIVVSSDTVRIDGVAAGPESRTFKCNQGGFSDSPQWNTTKWNPAQTEIRYSKFDSASNRYLKEDVTLSSPNEANSTFDLTSLRQAVAAGKCKVDSLEGELYRSSSSPQLLFRDSTCVEGTAIRQINSIACVEQ